MDCLFIWEMAETNDFSAIEEGSKSLWVRQVKASTIECQCFLTMSCKKDKLRLIVKQKSYRCMANKNTV